MQVIGSNPSANKGSLIADKMLLYDIFAEEMGHYISMSCIRCKLSNVYKRQMYHQFKQRLLNKITLVRNTHKVSYFFSIDW